MTFQPHYPDELTSRPEAVRVAKAISARTGRGCYLYRHVQRDMLSGQSWEDWEIITEGQPDPNPPGRAADLYIGPPAAPMSLFGG